MARINRGAESKPTSDAELIAREIEQDPNRPGPANVRLRSSGVPVWAIVGHFLHAVNRDPAAVARDYEISPEQVKAALAYYARNKAVIDGRLAENQPVSVD